MVCFRGSARIRSTSVRMACDKLGRGPDYKNGHLGLTAHATTSGPTLDSSASFGERWVTWTVTPLITQRRLCTQRCRVLPTPAERPNFWFCWLAGVFWNQRWAPARPGCFRRPQSGRIFGSAAFCWLAGVLWNQRWKLARPGCFRRPQTGRTFGSAGSLVCYEIRVESRRAPGEVWRAIRWPILLRSALRATCSQTHRAASCGRWRAHKGGSPVRIGYALWWSWAFFFFFFDEFWQRDSNSVPSAAMFRIVSIVPKMPRRW